MAGSSTAAIDPLTQQWIDPEAQLMTDGLQSYRLIGQQFAAHSTVAHGKRQYVNGETHTNTAESFWSLLNRGKEGVFHFMSQQHLHRYLDEFTFRWEQRDPVKKVIRKGKEKIVMKPKPLMEMLTALLSAAPGRQIRRTANNGIRTYGFAHGLSAQPFSCS